MSLAPHSRIGPYDIISKLGEGGMGEVYRANDPALGREVAIKVLPDAFASDPDRLARFAREAKALAALNHPNIAQVYGFEGSALVMELLEGETLRDRLRDGAMPARKAIDCGAQIARGLAAAHDRGIIHRDLKPENVFVLTDGRIKILDFGLARQIDAPVAGSTQTMTAAFGGTDPGTVMGTVGYMAPEQVRGAALDARADLFALGVVLYEMLTGRRAFQRDTAAESMTAILKDDVPDLTASRADLSPALDRIVRHCLEKNPIERFQTARDVAFALDSLSGSGSGAGAAVAAPAAAAKAARSERWIWAGITAALVGAIGWLLLGSKNAEDTPLRSPYRLTLLLPDGIRLSDFVPTAARLGFSPDGSKLAFVGVDSANLRRLWLQTLSDPAAHELVGSEGAFSPFWSPDGKWIGFSMMAATTSSLKKISVEGGMPVGLSTTAGWAAWNQDDVILVEPLQGAEVLAQTSGAGGPLTALVPEVKNGGPLRYVSFLPDGRRFLHHYLEPGKPQDQASTYMGSLDAPGRRLVLASPNASQAVFADGALVFVRAGTLFAQPFDQQQMQPTGDAVVIAEGVEQTNMGASFSVSGRGSLVYQPSRTNVGSRLVWINRAGAVMSTVADEADYSNMELARDGRRMLVSVLDPALRTRDIYIVDLVRGVRQRLTFDPSDERSAVWAANDTSVIYTSKGLDLYQRSAAFTGGETAVQTNHRSKDPREVSPDGRMLIYRETGETTSNDLWVTPLDGSGTPQLLVGTPFSENGAAYAPDGKSIVYASDESGRSEIYVMSLEPGGAKSQLSSDNGTSPRWRKDGKEIFYLNGDRMMMSVPVTGSGDRFQASAPAPLFRVETQVSNGSVYDVTADGQRFIVNAPTPSKVPPHLVVIVNWPALLK